MADDMKWYSASESAPGTVVLIGCKAMVIRIVPSHVLILVPWMPLFFLLFPNDAQALVFFLAEFPAVVSGCH